MKLNKKSQHKQRQILDQRVKNLPPKSPTKNDWINAVRNSLGITTRQLATLMKVGQNSITQLEVGEKKQSISLKNLVKAAEAMDCEVIYMIVPKAPHRSFSELLEKRAYDLALKISKGISHSMNLEQQKVSDNVTQNQIKDLALELKQNLDPRIWGVEIKLKGNK